MKKSIKYQLMAALIVFLAGCAFFSSRPLRLFTGEQSFDKAVIMIENHSLINGVPTIKTDGYEITSQRGAAVLDSLFGITFYRNSLTAVFSDVMEFDSKVMDIYLYEDGNVIHTIQISDNDHLTLDGKQYVFVSGDIMSDKFMEHVMTILEDHGKSIQISGIYTSS